MSKGSMLRSLVAERLTAAAEEIFALIERTVLEYEEELCRSKEENQRKQQLLDTVLRPQVNRAGVQFRMLCRTEESDSVFPASSEMLTTAQETHEKELSDGPEPKQRGDAGSGPQPEPPEEPEEQKDDLTSPFNSTPLEMNMMEEDESNQAEPSAEAADAQAEGPEKPAGRRGRRKHRRSSVKYGSAKRISKHQCSVCGKVLKGPPNNLLRHMMIHTGQKPYSCSICNKMFTQNCYFKKHMEGHEKSEAQKQAAAEKLETFSCLICDMKFKRQVTLRKHMETHGIPKESHQQPRKDTQSEHRREVGVQHELVKVKLQDEETETGVEEKGEDFTPAALIKPVIHAGSSAAPGDFQCHICPRSFTTRTRLKRHMIVHTGAKPFSCPVCHKLFSQKYNVRLHMAVHTNEKPYTCQICLKSYRRNDDLRTHMAGHTGQILFSCMVCNAAFKQRNCLVSHMRLHTGDRPYRCSVCDKTFIQKSNLNRHERSHTGEKPFRCPVCPQRFLQRCDIRKHMAIHT